MAEPLQGLGCLINQGLLHLGSSKALHPPASQVSEKMDNRHHPGQGAAHSRSLAGMGRLEAGKDLHERDKCVQGGSRARGEDKCQGELRMRGT